MSTCGGPIDQENFVQESLTKFLCENLADFDLSLIDDILIAYIVNVIKEDFESGISDEESESNFESLIEMLDGYISGVASLDRSVAKDWILKLSKDLYSESSEKDFLPKLVSIEKRKVNCENFHAAHAEELQNSNILENGVKNEYENKEMAALVDMFPTSCHLEISHCLHLSDGDVEKAAQLILHREEISDSISASPTANITKNGFSDALLDDKKVKDSIIAKYSYVDSAEDVKEHRPTMPKMAPKKLIRYRENKIVSLKGERFSDVKKNETDQMKKTYINLKPAKQYRFH